MPTDRRLVRLTTNFDFLSVTYTTYIHTYYVLRYPYLLDIISSLNGIA